MINKLVKVNFKIWKRSFPFICTNCKSVVHEQTETCHYCGKEGTLRKITKKDYRLKFKRMKEL